MPKICPLLSAGAKIKADMWKCLEGECTWWSTHQGACAITRIVMVKR